MYYTGVLMFVVALALYIPSRRSSAPARARYLRGFSYVVLGISLLLAAEDDADLLSWLVRAFGVFVLAQGSFCLLGVSKARSQDVETRD